MKKLILASSSPARKDILERASINFIVEPSGYDEDMSLPMKPKELAKYLSRGKAIDVAKKHKDAIVLGADSFAVLGSKLFGKPHTVKKAREMLETLSGRCHRFITGFTIIDSRSLKEYSDAVETKVYFRMLSKREIENYIKKENVLNNAGAYIIQGLGGVLVEKIEGDYLNVVGLPLAQVNLALQSFGISFI